MKATILYLMMVALSGLAPDLHAQTETFDLVTFTTPAGQRSSQTDVVGFTDATDTTFCQMAVYRHAAGSGDPARDFAAEWDLLVARHYRVTTPLNSETVDWPGGWQLTMGAAKVYSEGARNFVALLSVFSGYGVKISVLVNYNDDLYRPKVDQFLASIQLRVPDATMAAAPVAGAGDQPVLAGRTWHRSIANYSNWGYNPSPMEIAKIGNQGYAKWTYVFNPDGTYTFVHEFWSMSRHLEYWFTEEKGIYRATADSVTVTPRQARRVLRDKTGRQQGEAVPVDLEETVYQVRFHFMAGLGEWNLILTPLDGRETRRDGTFANHELFPASYLFGKPPAAS